MGQKVDARIFRQSLNKKNWEFKHIEKNNEESSLYLYKVLQIQKYLNRFFAIYKIKIHNCKIFYSKSTLQIFISFYVTQQAIAVINKKLSKHSKILTLLHEFSFFKKTKKRKRLYNKKSRKKKIRKIIGWFSKTKKQRELHKEKIRRKRMIKSLKELYNKKTKKKKKNILKRLVKKRKIYISRRYKKNLIHKLKNLQWTTEFQDILIESLSMYTKNNVNILMTLQNLNFQKRLRYLQIKNFKIVLKQLKKFVKNKFFKEAINILFISFSKRKSAKLLADFLSNQFRLNQIKGNQTTLKKKDNYFLGFLKQALFLLLKSEIAYIKGIKIIIKGRFNKTPRTKTNVIQFGSFPLNSLKSKIDYYSSIAYTINGTFGVKVWLCEK